MKDAINTYKPLEKIVVPPAKVVPTQHLQMMVETEQVIFQKLFKVTWWEEGVKLKTVVASKTKEEVEIHYSHRKRLKVKSLVDVYYKLV